MTDADPRSRWWVGLDELGEALGSVADPWPGDDAEGELSPEQVRFLESLADQPAVPRLTTGVAGLEPSGRDPADETGD